MHCVTRNDFKAATESATTLEGIFAAVTFWLQPQNKKRLFPMSVLLVRQER
jgi:hypothetical protein